MNATHYERLPTFGEDGSIHLIVEASRGAQAKFKYEPRLRAFCYSRPLSLGLAYPYDWGFVPSTRAPDGDPVDGMIVHEAASFAGAVVPCAAMGVLEIEQTEAGKTCRNDRLIFRPMADNRHPDGGTLLIEPIRRELERFFAAAVAETGKELRFLGWKGADAAVAIVKRYALDPA